MLPIRNSRQHSTESYEELPELKSKITVISDDGSGDKIQYENESIVANFENSLESTKFVVKTDPVDALETSQVISPIVFTIVESHGTQEKITTMKRKRDDEYPSFSEIKSENGNVCKIERKRYFNKGRIWTMFKPTYRNYLFFKIIQDLENVEKIVDDWIGIYKTNDRLAVYQILQFIIDICGYQNTDITRVFLLEVQNYPDIVRALWNNLTKTQKEGKCLFKARSKWAKEVQTVICDFFMKLMEGLYREKLLFNSHVIKYIFTLFISFTDTKVSSVYYTGSIVVCKICSVFLNIEKELDNMDLQPSRELWNNRIYIQQLVNSCHEIIKIIWRNDDFLMRLRLEILTEMGIWFERNSSVVKNHLPNLMFLLRCSLVSKFLKVRIISFGIYSKLISLNNFKDCIGRLMPETIAAIANRIDDVDYDVAIRAVELLILINPLAIPGDIGDKVKCLMYNQFYPLANISGQFFSHVFKPNPSMDSFTVLKCLIKFHKSINRTHRLTPLLVESLLPFLEEIKNVELIIQILLNNKFREQEDQIILIEILNNSMRQMITNKCKFLRIQPLIYKVDEKEVQKALVCFISKYLPLQDKFRSQKYCVMQLLEILLFIDYKNLDSNIFQPSIFEITNQLIRNFGEPNKEHTLLIVSQFLAMVKNFKSNGARICNEILPLTQKTTQIFVQILRKVKHNLISSEDIISIERNLLHFSVLIQYHDIFPPVNSPSFLFRLHFNLMKILGNRAKICIMRILCYYLIWKLKSAITKAATSNSFPKEEFQFLTQNLISHYFFLLTDKANALIYQPIFESLIEFVMEFIKVMRHSENIPNDYNIKIVFDMGQNALFMEIAIKILFEYQPAQTLINRKQIFRNILTLVYFKTVHIREVVKLFQYYFECDEDYGEIFDSYLIALREEGTTVVSGMIAHTLMYFYSNNVIACVITYDKNTVFKNLLEHFRKFIGRHVKEVIEIFKFATMFILQSLDRYTFLFYIQRLTSGLEFWEKKQIMSFLFAKIPKENQSHVQIVDFMKFCNIQIDATPNSNQKKNCSGNEENE